MKLSFRLFIVVAVFYALLPKGYAMEPPTTKIILKTDFKIWEAKKDKLDFFTHYQKTFFENFPIKVNEEDLLLVEPYLKNKEIEGMDVMKARNYLEDKVLSDINRTAEDVTIDMNEEGVITFDGKGFYGRELDMEKAPFMLKYAILNDIPYVNLPLIKTPPKVTVLNENLKEMGINELVGAGETDFRNSPRNRITNINVGLSKFNGHILKPEEELSFGEVLGPVDATTGYLPELVIKGAHTIPEYGGGLCQVSTTAYRAALNAGFPVTERRNHSYAVVYYEPHGLDATVYLPSPDMKFVNDSPAHILIQSFTEGNHAYYNYYGTKDDREVHLAGPYYTEWKSAPDAIRKVTDKLAPGEVQVVGHAVNGFTANWFREVVYNEQNLTDDAEKKDFLDHIYSKYQARPDFYLVGAESSGGVNFGIEN